MSDAYEDDLHGPHDHPVIAALAGCVVLVAAALLVPRMLPAYPQATLVGGFAAAGFALWLIALVVTVRLSTLSWKAGSLAILLGAGALAGFLAHRQYEAGGRQDPSTFADMEFGPQNNPVLPVDAASRGPVSRLFVAAVAADDKERRAFGEGMGKLGTVNLNNVYPLEQNPQILSRCGEIGALQTLADEHAAARAKRNAELLAAIHGAAFDAALKHDIAAIAVPEAGKPDPVQANQRATIATTAELCALLAKRGWYNANAYFGFRNAADGARHKALQARQAALVGESEKIAKDAAAAMKAAQERVRAALS